MDRILRFTPGASVPPISPGWLTGMSHAAHERRRRRLEHRHRRTLDPSLEQLDQAVRQYLSEHPESQRHRCCGRFLRSPHRRRPSGPAFEEAVAHGELVSPPAGAIGEGDAFLLRIAERIGARVLSNDSFREFHAEHPWLFDEDRLVGEPRFPASAGSSRRAGL